MSLSSTFVPANTVWESNRPAIQELLNKTIAVTMFEEDPIWRKMGLTGEGMTSMGPISRDLLIHKLLSTRVNTGVVEEGAPYGDFSLYGEGRLTSFGDKIQRQGSPVQGFPDPFNGVMPKFYRFSIPLRSRVASLGLTLDLARSDIMDPVIGKMVSEIFLGFAQTWTEYFTHDFYADQSVSYKLSSIGTGSSVDSVGRTVTFTPPDNTIDRYSYGQAVDLFNTTTRLNEVGGTRVRVYVAKIDPVQNKVVLALEQDTTLLAGADFTTITGAISSSTIAVRANSYSSTKGFTSVAGINSYMKFGGSADNDIYLLGAEAINSSTLGGAIDVRAHPEFRSLKWDLAGDTLTEHKMRLYLDAWKRAKGRLGRNHSLDTWLGTPGQLRAYQATKIAAEYYDRGTSGQHSLTNEGGVDELAFIHDGKKYTLMTSNRIEAGTSYMVKLGGGNWKKYVPPKTPGTQGGGDKVPSFVPFEFVGSYLNGTSSIQLPYRNSAGRPTTGFEMPGDMRMQVAPDQPDGIKFVNVAEDKVFADTFT